MKMPTLPALPVRRREPLATPPPDSGLEPVPGRRPYLPMAGEFLEYLRDPNGYLRRVYDLDGPVSWRSGAGFQGVVMLGPDAVAQVQSNKDRAWAHGPGYDPIIGKFFDRGLLLLDFDEHLFHKRVMAVTFGREKLIGYLDRMNPTIGRAIESWPEGEVRLSRAFKKMALDVATEAFLGIDLGPDAKKMARAFEDCVAAGSSVVRFPVPGAKYRLPGTAWSRGLAGRAYLEREIRALIPAKRADPGTDLFSALCAAKSDEGERFSDDDIVNQMIFLMFAAHDTSTATMTTMAYHLAKNPQWQQRCREESMALGEFPSYDELNQLESLDLVMKEALRLIAPIPLMFRSAVRDTEVLGHYIPAGTMAVVLPQFIHHMPELWTDPETFDPDRFGEARREDKNHKNAFMPFGSGAHKCIGLYFAGMEIKSTLHQLLRTFEFSVAPDYKMRMAMLAMPKVADGLPVTLKRLSPNTSGLRTPLAG
ncbi:cytochrome P450 [Nocardia sp. NPDC052001]|uniref:cytochrome P450 n=1 Tax=Nocardia sp. NPDC052001 TaxID=3154853 RepID=UPI00343919AF